jgi:hypothetical protein
MCRSAGSHGLHETPALTLVRNSLRHPDLNCVFQPGLSCRKNVGKYMACRRLPLVMSRLIVSLEWAEYFEFFLGSSATRPNEGFEKFFKASLSP